MHEGILAQALQPPGVRVLGLDLLPFSLGHEVVLWRRENPLVTGTREAFGLLPAGRQAEAVAEAVLVCCRRVPRWGWLWTRRAARLDVAAAAEAFMAYRVAGAVDLPTVPIKRSGPTPSFHYFGAPEVARLVNYVAAAHGDMVRVHYGGSVWNFPYGLARVLYTTHLECQGDVWVENFQDAQDRDRAKLFDQLNPEGTLAIGDEAVKQMAEKWNREHPEAPIPTT